jgi:hypothetical protein
LLVEEAPVLQGTSWNDDTKFSTWTLLRYACSWAQSLTLSNLQIQMVTRTWQRWILSVILESAILRCQE